MSEAVVASSHEHIGRYEVVGRLASGGMAEILLARLTGPKGFERPVAIKRILPHLEGEAQFVEMMADEASIAARIQHPNVVQIYELLEHEGRPHIVMEYLQGESLSGLLRRLIQSGQHLHQALAAHIVARASAGLHAAHEIRDADGKPLGVVHRDISPQNIFITYDGSVKVLDFGIAKATERYTRTHTGQLKGKFHYMSPEQALAQNVDRRTDIFALGIVLHEALTLRRLFKRDNELLSMKAIVEKKQRKPSDVRAGVTPVLDGICERALEKSADARYQDCAALEKDLALAARRLMPNALPEQQLKELMHQLFETREAEKKQMLRKLRGSATVTIPIAEVDLEVDVPAGADPSRSGVVSALLPEPVEELSIVVPRRNTGLVVGVTLGALLMGVAAFAFSGGDDAPVAEPVAAEVPAEEPGPVESIARVPVELNTQPPGAAVLVNGVERGQTPTRVMLERSDEVHSIELVLDGHQAHRLELVPDVAQRFSLQLIASPVRPEPRVQMRRHRMRSVVMQAETMADMGFHRFD